FDKAVEYLDEAVTLHPDYAAAWTLLGQVRVAQRLFPAAEAAFQRAIEIDPDYVPPYAPLTRLLSLRDRTQEVYDLSGKGLELNPYDVDLKYLRAATAFRLGDYEESTFFAQKIVNSDDAKFFPNALLVLARSTRAQGDFERAARLFGEYYADRSNNIQLRGAAGRELSEVRLAEYTLRTLKPSLP
ncbi:MAG: tetratricopeptide repeat protein, partial [Bryobacterales bacterium]|nr:tetratricopeptide repeat protein [Bryobacterales bacterium]